MPVAYQQRSRSSTATNRFLPGSLTGLVQISPCRLPKSFVSCSRDNRLRLDLHKRLWPETLMMGAGEAAQRTWHQEPEQKPAGGTVGRRRYRPSV